MKFLKKNLDIILLLLFYLFFIIQQLKGGPINFDELLLVMYYTNEGYS